VILSEDENNLFTPRKVFERRHYLCVLCRVRFWCVILTLFFALCTGAGTAQRVAFVREITAPCDRLIYRMLFSALSIDPAWHKASIFIDHSHGFHSVPQVGCCEKLPPFWYSEGPGFNSRYRARHFDTFVVIYNPSRQDFAIVPKNKPLSLVLKSFLI
jgi:hypothetical protein